MLTFAPFFQAHQSVKDLTAFPQPGLVKTEAEMTVFSLSFYSGSALQHRYITWYKGAPIAESLDISSNFEVLPPAGRPRA